MSLKRKLRSENWLNDQSQPDQTAIYLERYLNFGLTREELQSGKPIIGIAQTGSDLAPCNRHHIQLAERLKAGIRDAGGIPIEFPVHPIHEMGKRPTAALDRNLATLGLIEILYGYPLDGVILTTGCDKTTPATIMAAAAVDIPTIVFSGGPMLNGWNKEERIGSGTVIWKCREKYAAGDIDYEEFMSQVSSSAPSSGHCNTMGTALTMNSLAEALGMSLPGCAAIPGPYRERAQMAYFTGQRIVEMVWEDLKPTDILTKDAFINAIRVCSAIGGSTNAPVHIQAIANHLPEPPISILDWQTYGEKIPMLVNCQPAGEYLGEEFYRAGGVPAVIGELMKLNLICQNSLTVTGKTIGELHEDTFSLENKVIYSASSPLKENAGFAIMSGNLFNSALMKKSVINKEFHEKYLSNPKTPNEFEVRAIVFEGPEDYHMRINDPILDIDEDCILVIRNCGPIGYPGSAEVVNMLPPDYLVKQGITCLPTMGDGRQSGTSASPSILNIAPEAAAGGPLAYLETNDRIRINLNNNSVNHLVEQSLWEERVKKHQRIPIVNQTPWQSIYRSHVNQLSEGATLELEGQFKQIDKTHGIPRNSH